MVCNVSPMNTNKPDTATDAAVADMPNRHDLLGLSVVSHQTQEEESFIPFTKEEIDFVGMVEAREKMYAPTNWYTVRVWK